MSLRRYAAKRDAGEQAIFAAFRQAGCAVLPISAPGAPDAVVFHPSGRVWLVEVKARLGKLTAEQVRFRWTWRGPEIHTVRSIEDAIALVTKPWAKPVAQD